MPAAKIRSHSTPDAMKSEGKPVKSEKESQSTLDNIIRQAIGKDPFLSFPRASDNPVQWIQLIHALEQQGSSKVSRSLQEDCTESMEQSLELHDSTNSSLSERIGGKELEHSFKANRNSVKDPKNTSEQLQSLKIPEAVVAFAQAAAKANGEPEKYLPGWPLLSPPKAQLQKCDKCSLEFCSTINYRRHTRVHRRPLNIAKESPKTRELLGTFWDKLSTEEAKGLVSFENVSVEGVPGSSITRSLSSWVRKPGFASLPQTYVMAGVTLLDVVQASRFPITSHELFSALDDASEKTFLCSGTALSVQKFVFAGEAGKNALEMKNIVACTSFLLEQILVKAWLADKDAEALRCQKLLVEEEEAARKKQADILERKRLKKLRQKEQRTKELSDGEKADAKASSPEIAEPSSDSTGTSSPRDPSEYDLNTSDASLDQDVFPSAPTETNDPDSDSNLRQLSCVDDTNTGDQMLIDSEHWNPHSASQHGHPKQTRRPLNGYHTGQVVRHVNYRESRSALLVNSHKIWTPKSKHDADGANEKGAVGREQQLEEVVLRDKTKIIIGSISVALGDCNGHPHHMNPRHGSYQEKSDSIRAPVKLWRPVSRHGNGDSATARNDKTDAKINGGPTEMEDDNADAVENSENVHHSREFSEPVLFSREVAEAFLAQRWKEAIAVDHVKLVLSSETETLLSEESFKDDQPSSRPQSAGRSPRSTLSGVENQMMGMGVIDPASACASKPKFRSKQIEKGYRQKYVPKQRSKISEE